MRQYQILDTHQKVNGRQVLSVWSGEFASNWEGDVFEVYDPDDGTSGWVIETPAIDHEYCPAPRPRTEENYLLVDKAISDFINERTP